MTSSMTQILFNWNSEAVLKMQENRPGEAIAIFQKCLQAQADPAVLVAAQEEEAARLAAMEAESEVEEFDENEPEEYRDKWDEIVEEMRLEAEEHIDDDESGEDEDRIDPYTDLFTITVPVNAAGLPSESVFRLFDHAFITTCLVCDDTPGRESPDFIRAFLLFNMGLCVHQQATRRSQAQMTALNIYRTALQTLQASLTQGHVSDVIMLMLALNNNIAYIHAEYTKDFTAVQHCIANIRTLIESSARVDFRRHGGVALTFFCVSISVMADSASFTTAGAA